MKYITEILQQFTPEQRFLVLLVLLIFICGTYFLTVYFKSPQKSCHDLMQLNQRYVEDFVKISNMIRENKMKELQIDSVSKGFDYTIGGDDAEVDYSPDDESGTLVFPILNPESDKVLDSILKITEETLKK